MLLTEISRGEINVLWDKLNITFLTKYCQSTLLYPTFEEHASSVTVKKWTDEFGRARTSMEDYPEGWLKQLSRKILRKSTNDRRLLCRLLAIWACQKQWLRLTELSPSSWNDYQQTTSQNLIVDRKMARSKMSKDNLQMFQANFYYFFVSLY